ncbi:MAG: hypothetical protein HYY05_05290, partial [Chloroflexi bacterium]|nr:hypothetical protein [Chloroflexota bacterium]
LLQDATPLGPGPEQATLLTEDDWLELMLTEGALLYRARLLTAPSTGKLRALVRLEGPRGRSHRDSLDLYSHKARKVFSNRAAERFEGLTPGAVEAALERLIDQAEQAARTPVPEEKVDTGMSDQEKEQALAFLRRPDLVEAILSDIHALGYVGEETAKLLVYLIAVSRRLEKPLSGILRSESAAGKSFVAELAEQLTPPEGVVLYSRISALALAYSPEDSLKGKLLILEERAGGEAADYTIRTLQSKKRLTQKVTIKDPSTGRMVAREYTVEGPIAYLETTTSHQLNPENTSRCFEIPLDESPEQTRRIHERQRQARSLEFLGQKEEAEVICRRHHNLQRLLEPVRVVIPYAGMLTFPTHYLRTRRDHERFLSLIEVLAFLHQHQRPRRTGRVQGKEVVYIEATADDYRIAYDLAQRVLRVSLDELTRWSRELYELLEEQAHLAEAEGVSRDQIDWSRRQIRDTTRWPDRRLRECLKELVDMEYLELVRGGSQGKTYVYRLAPNPGVSRAVLGLLTPQELEVLADGKSGRAR